MRFILPGLLFGLLASQAQAAIHTESVEYSQGGAKLIGYLAYDPALGGKRPGVLVVHEWWGLKSYPKMRAEQLAKMGYVAFAADIYGDGKSVTTVPEAQALAGKFYGDKNLLRQRVNAGLDILKKNKLVDPARIAAIGFCFGGSTVLELARSGADVKGVVCFHGGLATSAPDDSKIKAKILVLNGGDDPNIPDKQVTDFKQEMKKAGADWQLVEFGGTVHAYTNPAAGNDPSKGMAYNEKSEKRAWTMMQDFFRELFGK